MTKVMGKIEVWQHKPIRYTELVAHLTHFLMDNPEAQPSDIMLGPYVESYYGDIEEMGIQFTVEVKEADND